MSTPSENAEGEGFRSELAYLMNRYNKEGHSNTPDFLLAQYIEGCVTALNTVINARDVWYGANLAPGAQKDPAPQVRSEVDPIDRHAEPQCATCGHGKGLHASQQKAKRFGLSFMGCTECRCVLFTVRQPGKLTPLEFARGYHNHVHDIAARGDGPVGYTVWAWEEMSQEHRDLLCLAAELFLEEK